MNPRQFARNQLNNTMPYVALENFKGGLDTRRSNLTSLQGVLENLTNAFINQGGEIEKRKAWVVYAPIPTTIPTFGFERLKDTLVIFGGDDDTGITWPADVTYQRLVRADEPNGIPSSQATCVISSSVFNGKTVVLAKMDDGTTCLFYDGTFVADYVYGRVYEADTQSFLNQLAKAIDVTVYTGTSPSATTVQATAEAGMEFSANVVEDGVGTLTPVLSSKSVIYEQAAQQAHGSFQIFGGATGAGNQVTFVKVNGVDLLAGTPVLFDTNPTITAAAVATRINSVTTSPNYIATADGPVVNIYAADTGVAANGLALAVTVAGSVILSPAKISFGGTSFDVDYINVDGTDLLEGTPHTYAAPASLTDFVTGLQNYINGTNASAEYVALSVGPSLLLGPKVISCQDEKQTLDISVSPVAGSTGYIEQEEPSELSLIMSTDKVTVARHIGTSYGWRLEYGPYSVTPVGGTPPYTYLWDVEGRSNFAEIYIYPRDKRDFTLGVVTTDQVIKDKDYPPIEIKVTVTDSEGQRAEASITLNFST